MGGTFYRQIQSHKEIKSNEKAAKIIKEEVKRASIIDSYGRASFAANKNIVVGNMTMFLKEQREKFIRRRYNDL